MPEAISSDESGFIVVKVDDPLSWSVEAALYAVLPREEPHTYATLQGAAELVASLIVDFCYTTETTRVYKLVPVANEEVSPLIQQALDALRHEDNK